MRFVIPTNIIKVFLLSIPVILVVLFLVVVEDEGIYGCYMDNGDMEYCKDREKVFTYEECVASVMKDIHEDDDAVARDWCGELFDE